MDPQKKQTKVAAVTGANKGLGKATVEQLCRVFKGDVYLTSRDIGRGHAAVKELQGKGLQPKYHQLDITDSMSITAFKKHIWRNYGGLDVLINNAGVMHDSLTYIDQDLHGRTEKTMRTNFWGTLNVCRSLFPLLNSNARVVNISSRYAYVGLKYCTKELREAMTSEHLTINQLENLMMRYQRDVKSGHCKENGWLELPYCISKIGIATMTRIQQQVIDASGSRNILINACCPGFVSTDMSQYRGAPVEKGCITPVSLAMLPPKRHSPHGDFVAENTILPWSHCLKDVDCVLGDFSRTATSMEKILQRTYEILNKR